MFRLKIGKFLRPALCALFCGVVPFSSLHAEEIILTNSSMSKNDSRFEYHKKILETALAKTAKEYGDFKLAPYPVHISRKRSLDELIKGTMTIFGAPTRRAWEEKTIPIRIPIRKGLLGYRLLLINDRDQERFSNIQTLDELKKLTVGSGAQWSATQALKRLGFNVTGGNDYEGLFIMLKQARFDYFPRGVNEIFKEFDSRKKKYPQMRIEDKLSIYLPLPTYFFVTPKRPDLALRLEKGLMEMVSDGTLDLLFDQYYGPALKRANLKNRKIFSLPNPSLTEETPFDREEFWYKP